MQKINFQNTTNLPSGYEEREHNEMRFGLFVPPNYNEGKKYPLILALHGKLDLTSWNLPWYNETIVSKDPCVVVTPKTSNPNLAWGNSNNENHTPEMLTVLEILNLLKKEFNLDENRFYVHGASMGGFGVFNLLAKEPKMFAAAIAICGGGSPSTANILKEIPLWIFHGNADPIISVEQSRKLYKAILLEGGIKVRYTEYSNIGHDSWVNAWNESTILYWFLSQRKNYSSRSPKPPENFRYEFIEKGKINLTWNSSKSKNIWYYKIFSNNKLIAEVDNNIQSIIVEYNSEILNYSIIAVNYFFKESEKIELNIYPTLFA
ncbi:MAG: prolyl oligopeptidase family serine peptidase [Ignavibacteriae bacterium]|nr:prolyl oligopeptidase family serine peptidase [Ignavibacteriota bacterium]